MRHDHNNKPLTEIRPRRLPYAATIVALTLPCAALIAFQKDIVIQTGVPIWIISSTAAMALLAFLAYRLLHPAALMTISPEGITLPALIQDTLKWAEIRKVEAKTRRGQTGDIHDRLVIHLKQPQDINWRAAKLRDALSGTPQIAIAVDVGFQWPSRADDIKRIIRDAAKTYAAAPTLKSETPATSKRRHQAVLGILILAFCALPTLSLIFGVGLPRMFSEGLALYRAGDVSKAVPLLEPDARAGDAETAYALGELYLNGDGVGRNLSMSAGWFMRAVDHGHTDAAFKLANAHKLGLGIPQNIEQAFALYRNVSSNGSSEAAYALGRIYRLGDGVRRDYPKALKWLRISADEGFAPAEHELGQLYQEGIAVPRDIETAKHWLSEAASKGHAPARFDLARLLLDGDITSRQSGFAILQLSANNGYAPAQRRLAAMYFKGQGIQTDAIAAYQWISLAERSWPAATRADLVREKARIANTLDANALAQAKFQIRNWRPLRN